METRMTQEREGRAPMTVPPRRGASDEGLPMLGEALGTYVLQK
jgi:hypothetical protein